MNLCVYANADRHSASGADPTYHPLYHPLPAPCLTNRHHLSISRSWRHAVLSLTEFFISPRWTWPTDAFDEWRRRSGDRGLNFDLDLRGEHDNILSFETAVGRIHRVSSHLRMISVVLCEPTPGRDGRLMSFPWAFNAFSSAHAPSPFLSLQSLIIIGRTRADRLVLDASLTPFLEVLHVPDTTLIISGDISNLRTVGLRTSNSSELAILNGLLGSQSVPQPRQLHVTMYGPRNAAVRSEFAAEIAPHALEALYSLQLRDFRGRDHIYIVSLVSQLRAPRLKVLELLKSDWKTATEVIKSLPQESARGIETLVLDFTRSIIGTSLDAIFCYFSSVHPFLRLPALKTLVFFSSRDGITIESKLDLDAAEMFFTRRQGTLGRICIPHRSNAEIDDEPRWRTMTKGVEVSAHSRIYHRTAKLLRIRSHSVVTRFARRGHLTLMGSRRMAFSSEEISVPHAEKAWRSWRERLMTV
ncbi:hypothetical protein DL93DRAFT_1511651 [Clavulina sp. PMI_390]|nr:hypothetical protein DL93DRAFT_1511651 [Clavulina sp. PMI_390]